MKPQSILITGGAGFIGSHLAARFCTNARVVLFDNFRRDSLAAVPSLREHPNVTVMTGDVLDRTSLARALEGCDTVLHLAAIAGVSSYYTESLRTLQVNILGTANLLEEAVRSKISRFVHFSTSETFGSDALWVHEESGFRIGPTSDRRWVYATSKLAGEHFALRYAEAHGFSTTVVRPFNIYGPRQTGEGAISNFCKAALAGRPLKVYGDGTPIRAWCYIADMVDAIDAVLSTDASSGQTFNIGNPREVETTLGLARRVARLVPGTTLEFEAVDRTEVRARVPVVAHAAAILGFAPKVDLEEGLTRTLAWYKETA